MVDCLLLRLEAPMTSFGGDVIDNRGVVRDFPGRSMLAGLIGNALGYERHHADALDALQSRIVETAVIVRSGQRMRDYQTARLFEKDVGWTTRGQPEGRASSPSFTWDGRYEQERGIRMKALTHQRYRDFDADASTLVALSLTDDIPGPDMDEVESALNRPARPLFIGRKPNLPSGPLARGRIDSPSVVEAACTLVSDIPEPDLRFQCSRQALPDTTAFDHTGLTAELSLERTSVLLRALQLIDICDERRHLAGVHAGTRTVVQGWMTRDSIANDVDADEERRRHLQAPSAGAA